MKILSVECILGADFLVHDGTVIDCKANTLALGENPQLEVPIYNTVDKSNTIDKNTGDC